MSAASSKIILYAFLANAGLAVAKSWAAFFTGSGSMLAEAIHSYADCGNQLLLFVGLRQSAQPADAQHPLGYGKVTYFWSFIVAVLLFSVGGLFSIYEGWHKLHAPEPINHVWVALTVLGVGIVLESFSLFGAFREIKSLRQGKPFLAWFKHTRNAETVVILGEDTAAILGLATAFVFLLAASVTGEAVYDALGSISIGVILLIVSIFIGWRIKKLIVGTSAEPDIVHLIDQVIQQDNHIEELLESITLQFGPDIILLAKLRMNNSLSINIAVAELNELEARLKTQIPKVKWCFLEPDIKR